MSMPARSDKEQFERELNHYRSLAKANKRGLEKKPFLAVQLNFWMESVRFLITELEVWEYVGNRAKYEATIKNLGKAFYYIHKLVVHLDDENYEDREVDLDM